MPSHLRALRELRPEQVERPDYAWLAYAVCAVDPDACGWGGWMLEVAFKRDGQRHATGTGDRALDAADEQRCPRCGRETFRTAAVLRMEPSADQAPVRVAGQDYEVSSEEGDG